MGFFNKLFGTEEDNTTIASEMQRVADDSPSTEQTNVVLTPHPDISTSTLKGNATADTNHSPAPSSKQAPHQVGKPAPESSPAAADVSNRNRTGTLPPPAPRLDGSPNPEHVAAQVTQAARVEPPSSAKPKIAPRLKLSAKPKTVLPQRSVASTQHVQRKHQDTLPGIAKTPDLQAEFQRQLEQHGAAVREYLVAAGLGPVSADWAASVTAALGQLRDAARAASKNREVRLIEQTLRAMEEFALGDAKSEPLLADLSELLPGKLSIRDEMASRELLLIDNLVRLIPEVRNPTVERLKQGSLWSLNALRELDLTEAAKRSGVDCRSLARISDLVKEHLQRRKGWHPVPSSQFFKESLSETLKSLQRFDKEFEHADRDEDRVMKRKAREARRQAVLRVNLMLVESGDLDVLATVERMKVADKITHLRVVNGE